MAEKKEDLYVAFRDLPLQKDYFSGAPQTLFAMPRAVLMFSRTGREYLGSTLSMHYRFMLIAALEGDGGVILDGKVLRLQPGECVLVQPFQGHAYTGFTEEPVLWFFITFELAAGEELTRLRSRVCRLGNRELPVLRDIRTALGAEQGNLAAAGVANLLALLLEQADRRRAPTKPVPADDVVARAVEWINRQIENNPEAQDVAQAMCLSASRLREIFRRQTGVALGTFIRRQSIYRAVRYLREEGLNVSQTAERCGYSSVYAFSRTFKAVMGSSPQNFRLQTGVVFLPGKDA